MSDNYPEVAVTPEDALRGLPPVVDDDAEPGDAAALDVVGLPADVVRFRIEPTGEPQNGGTPYHAIDEETGRRFYVGKVAAYYSRKGISRYSGDMVYDRGREQGRIGLWAHFIWPTVMAEGAGRHIVINSWDRAHCNYSPLRQRDSGVAD